MPLRSSALIGLLVDWHQPLDTHVVQNLVLVLQVISHLQNAVKLDFEELLVDHGHMVKIYGRLTHKPLIERRPGNRPHAVLCLYQ